MGAWGSNPKDNDGAADFFYRVDDVDCYEGMKVIWDLWEKDGHAISVNTDLRWEYLGMFQLYLERMEDVYSGSEQYKYTMSDERFLLMLWKAVQMCHDCINDNRWASDWQDEEELKKNTLHFRQYIFTYITKLATESN